MTAKKFDFTKAIKDLEEINKWFQEEEIDLDEGLKKLKLGKELIKQCRERIKEVENEFVDIKKDFVYEIDTETEEDLNLNDLLN
ncbi:MAG: exodeoxyribonuclease VII small subunit [Patescibacteria group bacterium]